MTLIELIKDALEIAGVTNVNYNISSGESARKDLRTAQRTLSGLRLTFPFKTKIIYTHSQLSDISFVKVNNVTAILGSIRYRLTEISRDRYNFIATPETTDGLPVYYLFEEFNDIGGQSKRQILPFPNGTEYQFEVIGITTSLDQLECDTDLSNIPLFNGNWLLYELARAYCSAYKKPWGVEDENLRISAMTRNAANTEIDATVRPMLANENTRLLFRPRNFVKQ